MSAQALIAQALGINAHKLTLAHAINVNKLTTRPKYFKENEHSFVTYF